MKKINKKTVMNEKASLPQEQVASFENEGNFIIEKMTSPPEKKGCRCVQNVQKKHEDENKEAFADITVSHL
jgi:hypothetical protein